MCNNKTLTVVHVIDQENVVLNGGKNYDIKLGEHFIIYGIGEEIFDPETKQSLGKLELVRGKGSVIHVQDKMCIVKNDEYEDEPATTEIRMFPNMLGMLTYGNRMTEEKKIIKSGKKKLIGFRNVEEGDQAKSF